MRLREIPRDDWPDFCAGFTRTHRGSVASLLRVDPWGDSEVVARGVPLESVFPGAQEGGVEAEVVCVTLGGGDHEMLAVDAPRRIWLAEMDGRDRALRIDSADGASTLVVFGSDPQSVPATTEE